MSSEKADLIAWEERNASAKRCAALAEYVANGVPIHEIWLPAHINVVNDEYDIMSEIGQGRNPVIIRMGLLLKLSYGDNLLRSVGKLLHSKYDIDNAMYRVEDGEYAFMLLEKGEVKDCIRFNPLPGVCGTESRTKTHTTSNE